VSVCWRKWSSPFRRKASAKGWPYCGVMEEHSVATSSRMRQGGGACVSSEVSPSRFRAAWHALAPRRGGEGGAGREEEKEAVTGEVYRQESNIQVMSNLSHSHLNLMPISPPRPSSSGQCTVIHSHQEHRDSPHGPRAVLRLEDLRMALSKDVGRRRRRRGRRRRRMRRSFGIYNPKVKRADLRQDQISSKSSSGHAAITWASAS
jgi:hypothetical protein